MWTDLLLLIPLVVAEATEHSPAKPASRSSIVQDGVIKPLPTLNSPRHLPILPDLDDLVSTSPTTRTAVSSLGATRPGSSGGFLFGSPVTASTPPSQTPDSVSERLDIGAEVVISEVPLLGPTTSPYTTAMTMTVLCELNHTRFHCDMPMNGLEREVCVTAESQVLCHVPTTTRTRSVAEDVVDAPKTASVSVVTECSPVATISTTPVAISSPKGHASTGNVTVLSETDDTDVEAVTGRPTALGSSRPKSSSSQSAGAAMHSHHTTKAAGKPKVNAAPVNDPASLNQLWTGMALVVILLASL